MKAQELLNERSQQGEHAFAELRVWQVPQPVRGSAHAYKYRLAFVVEGVCVVRFDNEAGKGDHWHRGDGPNALCFHHPAQPAGRFLASRRCLGELT